MSAASHRRAVARKLALQAIYRWLLNPGPWQDVVREFADDADMHKADRDYFEVVVSTIATDAASLDIALAAFTDRAPAELDPVEHAVLLVGLYELKTQLDIPFRVVLSEGVGLARRFGATDGHKYVNAVLDRAARELRPGEH